MSRPLKGSSSTCRQRKLECVCGCIVRMSRAAMLKHGLPTCGCGQPFAPDDIEDAAILGDQILHDHPDFLQEMVRENAKAIREARAGQGGADRMRCGGCSAFIGSATAPCGCGFANDIQGARRRNHGGYVEGASSCAEKRREAAIPF